MHDLPNVHDALFAAPTTASVFDAAPGTHKPRILLLHGSLREPSCCRGASISATTERCGGFAAPMAGGVSP